MRVDEIPASVNMSAAIEPESSVPAVVDSVGGASGLSQMQRNFAREFVMNGGKASEAALAAGYAEPSARISATKCLANPRVGAEIARLSRGLIHSALPRLIAELVNIATDQAIAPRDRLKALNSLLERGGIATDKAGVQVNVGVQVNGQQAQALISEVWSARSGRLSDIPPAMPDKELKQIEQSLDALSQEIPDGPGGDAVSGTLGATAPVPVSPCANAGKSSVSCECPQCRAQPAPKENDDGFSQFRAPIGRDAVGEGA